MPKLLTAYLPVTAVVASDIPAGIRLSEIGALTGAHGPVVCAVNGAPVLRSAWPDTVIGEADLVSVAHLPQGGGGDSDPARIAATIGIMALAMAVPGMLGLVGANGVTIWGAMAAAGVSVGGSYLVNAIMPIDADIAVSHAGNQGSGDTSPTYSLTSPTNMTRIGSVIPVQYGRIRSAPALAAAPWFEFDDLGRQWYHVLLDLGHGDYDVEKMEFDNVDFSAMGDNVEYSVLAPGDAVPWHDNVYTSPHVDGSEEVKRQNDTSFSGINITTTYAAISGTGYAFFSSSAKLTEFYAGDVVSFTGSTYATGQYTIRSIMVIGGGSEYRAYIEEDFTHGELFSGGVSLVATFSETSAWPVKYRDGLTEAGRSVFCDVVFPNGLYTRNTDGTIEDATATLRLYCGAVAISDEIAISKSIREPVRVSIAGVLPASGSDLAVHIRRSAAPINDYIVDACYWAGLRVVYDDVAPQQTTRIAVHVVASEGLSQDALSKIRVTRTRKLPSYNPATHTWSANTATRSIAWAAADACRNSAYSVGANDAGIDLVALAALDAIWTARGDYCDGIFENKGVFWDRLNQILRCGRAQAHLVGNLITFTRDQPQSVYRAVFTPESIKKGTFAIEPVLYDPDTPDDVDAEYFDSGIWQWKTVTCSLAGSSSEAPAKKRYWGITEATQAEREGIYDAACNMYRRLFVSFTTDMSARIILRGHLVSVTHPLCDWGVGGAVKAIAGYTLTLSEPVTFGQGDHYISFRDRDGSQDGPYLVTAGATEYQVVMAVPVPSHVTTDINIGRTHFQFGHGEDFHKPCLVVGCVPRGNGEVELALVVDDDRVYTADGTEG